MAKKRYIFIEILLVAAILAIPPIFAPKAEGIPCVELSPFIFVELAAALALKIQFDRMQWNSVPQEEIRKRKTELAFKTLYWWAICLAFLMFVYAVFQLAAFFFHEEQSKFSAENMNPLVFWGISILNLAIASFYEEVLYRQFLPESLLFVTDSWKKGGIVISESVALILFSGAHLYLGPAAALNSLICGAILRFTFRKSRSVWAGTIAHFFYNVFVLVTCLY